jgi:hypothetical protein
VGQATFVRIPSVTKKISCLSRRNKPEINLCIRRDTIPDVSG